FRSASFRPRWRPFLVERNGLQGAATRFPIRRRSVRNFARVRRLSITFREGDKAIRLMIRKRIEEHRINHAEKRRVRSDAQGQSYHRDDGANTALFSVRSEEHTSELQSRENLVCRLLLEKK